MRRLGDSSAGPSASRSRDAGARGGTGSASGAAAGDGASGYGSATYGAAPYGAATRGAPNHGAPNHGAPNHGAPNHGAPNHGAPNHGAPNQGAAGHRAAGGGRSGNNGAGRGAQPGTGTGTGQHNDPSVFVPGYRGPRPGRDSGHQAAGPGTPSASWQNSYADAAVGKGPVRGFPPTPGQPPPLYPPGQFAAWNRMSPPAGDSRAGTRPRTSPDPSGGAGAWASSGLTGQPGQARYGESEPGGQAYEPGYSALAVSDPAADVTSTQTWQAIGDGLDGPGGAGAWSDPRGAAVPASPAGASSASAPPGASSPGLASLGSPGGRSQDIATGAGGTRTADGRQRAGGSRPAGSRAAARAAGSRAAGSRGGRSARKGGSSRTGRRSPGPVLAICVVLVLALTAVAFLLLTARHQGATAAGGPATTPPASTPTTPTPSPTLGQFGHIASRTADPLPLTITQLFPRTFTVGGASYARVISQVSKSCTVAIVGTSLQTAVTAAKCDQVVRASYISTVSKVMGTIGVLNLTSAAAAEHAGRSAGPADFIAQLRGRKGATQELGKGTGIEEAAAKGHYLILIWAQFTSRAKPTTSAQRTKLATFMNDLFQQTANISLSSRMVDGTP